MIFSSFEAIVSSSVRRNLPKARGTTVVFPRREKRGKRNDEEKERDGQQEFVGSVRQRDVPATFAFR
jgi:hypothetical protein